MKKALIVRNGTSGRFSPIAAVLSETGWTGAVINGPVGTDVPGWINVRWTVRAQPEPITLKPTQRFHEAMLCAGAAAGAANKLKENGFVPDVIIGHPGFGEMLFLAEVFPGVPQIQVGEYYYLADGADANFDPEFPAKSLNSRVMNRAQNAVLAMSYAEAAAIVAPTPFQASLLPECFRGRTEIIHEGVDMGAARRRSARFRLPNGTVLDGSVPAVSFVNRRFEPLRGFHVFMRMLPRLLERAPDVHVVLVGADDPDNTYGGARPANGRCWREAMLVELSGKLDPRRVHFVAPVPYEQLQVLFSNVAAHVYLTYPFVLSWSLLDAMACEALVVGSDTAPVRDVVEHGRNGLLVDFFDGDAMAETLATICRDPARFDPLRKAARATVAAQYDRHAICMPAWRRLVERVTANP